LGSVASPSAAGCKPVVRGHAPSCVLEKAIRDWRLELQHWVLWPIHLGITAHTFGYYGSYIWVLWPIHLGVMARTCWVQLLGPRDLKAFDTDKWQSLRCDHDLKSTCHFQASNVGRRYSTTINRVNRLVGISGGASVRRSVYL